MHFRLPSLKIIPFLSLSKILSIVASQMRSGSLLMNTWPPQLHHVFLLAVSVDEKYQGLCSGVYDYFSWKYGTRSNKAHRKTKKQKCSKQEISVLRQERNKARQQLRKAKRSSSDPESLRELARKFHQYLCKYSRLSRAESRHCRKLQETRARKECGKNSGSLQLRFWMMVMATLKYSQLSMWVRQRSISQLCIAVNPDHSVSLHGFLAHQILKYLSFEEVQGIIKKVRVKSSPSPLDQIPYSVFKKCPSLTVALVNLFNTCWDLGRGWKQGVIRLIPKAAASEDPLSPSNFHPIALTSCVGKLFTSLLKNRWLSFITTNGYLDTSIQKAFLPGTPGCLGAVPKAFCCYHRSTQETPLPNSVLAGSCKRIWECPSRPDYVCPRALSCSPPFPQSGVKYLH